MQTTNKKNTHSEINFLPNINYIQVFDEQDLENNLHEDLKLIESLVYNSFDEIKISSNSSLILICLPILKKIVNLKEIKLVINKGVKPSELLRIAKVIRANQLPVKLEYNSNH